MENAENILGGAPPSVQEQREMEESAGRLLAQAAAAGVLGVQAAPTSPSTPIKLDEVDLLKYQLLGSKVSEAHTKVMMYERELQHAQIERARLGHEATLHMKGLEEKYQVDFRQSMVTEDGYIIARPLNHGLERKF